MLAEISLLLNSLSSDIDLSASFVQSGGDSLSAIALVSACRRHGIDLDVGLILSSPSISDLLESGLTYRLPTENTCSNTWPQSDFELQEEMMSPSRTCADSEIATLEDIYPQCKALDTSRPSTSQAYPITEMQLSLLQSSQTDPGTNVITYYETYRPRDIPAMKRAWKAVIDSEPIFRTAFILYEGKGRLVEQDEAPFPWSETMVLTQEAFDASVEGEYVDTGVAMLFRVVTLPDGPRGEGKSTIIWHVHHALIDGYSNGLVIQKLRSVAAGLPYSPGPSFAQLAGHLNTFHQRSRAVGQQFWKNEHEKYPLAAGGILLPAPLPRRQSKRNTTMTVTVNTSFNKTSVYAQRIGITLASLYYAAWALTLSTYVDSDTVVFGAVLSGRDLPLARVKETTGPVINMLPLHISCDRTSTTVDYLRHVFSRLIELASFQWTRPEDGFRRQFSSALAMQFESPTIDTPGISPLARPHSRVVSDVPLHVLIEPDGVIHLNYHSNTYDRIHIEAIGERFRRALLSLLVPHDTITICLEGLLFCQIRQDLYRLGNCKSNLTTAQSIDDDLVALFQGISANFPSAIAVQKGARSLAYAELNRLADCVATSISSLIRPGEVICVHSDRSVNWIVAIYGILKAGGVYCPLDEALPKGLRDSNFKLAGGKLFLTPSVADKVARPSGCMSCISIDEIIACTPKERDIRDPLLLPPLSPAANAYLCFTSGTTGKPKGVMCTHQGLVAFQKDLEIRLLAAPGRRISQLMSPAFDGSIHEIFSALSYGATLVLNDSADPFAHLGSVDSAMLTPSVARMLEPADFPLLSTVSFECIGAD